MVGDWVPFVMACVTHKYVYLRLRRIQFSYSFSLSLSLFTAASCDDSSTPCAAHWPIQFFSSSDYSLNEEGNTIMKWNRGRWLSNSSNNVLCDFSTRSLLRIFLRVYFHILPHTPTRSVFDDKIMKRFKCMEEDWGLYSSFQCSISYHYYYSAEYPANAKNGIQQEEWKWKSVGLP